MRKFVKEYTGIAGRYEMITIDGDIATIESLHITVKAVYETKLRNIINDFGWKDLKDYIQWIKQLEFKELKEYRDDLNWINPHNNESLKQYQFSL